jgi:sugar lactone lactonase YvrE
MRKLTTLIDGLAFPEGPRWHDSKLYFSDMHALQVIAVDMQGRSSVVCEVTNRPSGLGWLPDGRMLVVSMRDRKLLRLDPGGLNAVADMTPYAPFDCNDMVVDAKGRAYIGNFGFDLHKGEQPRATTLVMVTPEGLARIVAENLEFPNGSVITSDGRTLIVAETMGRRLTAFDIKEDGTLTNRRVYAELGANYADGIGLDAEGAVWVASPLSHEVIRVKPGGEITERLKVDTDAFACILGGPTGRTLFVATAENSDPEQCRQKRSGRIEITEVEVPHAGLP